LERSEFSQAPFCPATLKPGRHQRIEYQSGFFGIAWMQGPIIHGEFAMFIAHRRNRLPHVRDYCPEVPLFMKARAIATAYRDTLEQPIPEHLASLLRRLDSQEKKKGPRAHD
jgi:hypothetical protein